MGAPLPKSAGSCVILCEYLLLTKSAVLSALCGLSRGASSRFPDLLDSLEGRPELESVAAASPVGTGALICRGALIAGGGPPFWRLSVRFLRSEMPFPRSSDMLPASLESPKVLDKAYLFRCCYLKGGALRSNLIPVHRSSGPLSCRSFSTPKKFDPIPSTPSPSRFPLTSSSSLSFFNSNCSRFNSAF